MIKWIEGVSFMPQAGPPVVKKGSNHRFLRLDILKYKLN
jgi:hypothetical protein